APEARAPAAARVLRSFRQAEKTQDSTGGRVSLACRRMPNPRLPLRPGQLWRERRAWAIGLGVAALLFAVVAFVAYQELKRPPDVHNERAIQRFVEPKPPRPQRARTVDWPMYGLNPARTR